MLLRALEVGVCGTDREISDGLFGVAPEGERRLVLGHELLGEVARDGHGYARGDLVTATVRRSCGRCAACAAGAPDACLTGDYSERGITRLDGFAAEFVAEHPDHLVAVPRVARAPRRARGAGVDVRARPAPRPRRRATASRGGRGGRSSSARGRSACSPPRSCASTASRCGRWVAPRRAPRRRAWPRPSGRATRRPRRRRRASSRATSAASTSSSRPRATRRSCSTPSACWPATGWPACSASTPPSAGSPSTAASSASTRSSATAR